MSHEEVAKNEQKKKKKSKEASRDSETTQGEQFT